MGLHSPDIRAGRVPRQSDASYDRYSRDTTLRDTWRGTRSVRSSPPTLESSGGSVDYAIAHVRRSPLAHDSTRYDRAISKLCEAGRQAYARGVGVTAQR